MLSKGEFSVAGSKVEPVESWDIHVRPEVAFYPKDHVYKINGVRKPSVTAILDAEGITDYRFCPESAKRRGSLVHEETAAIESGSFVPTGIPAGFGGYVDAWLSWKDGACPHDGLSDLLIEEPLYGYDLDYCGTPDRVYMADRCIPDMKTGEPRASDAIQLAAYALLATFKYPDVKPEEWRRVNVYLAADGSYEEIPREDPADFEVFKAAARVCLWRRLNGMWRYK